MNEPTREALPGAEPCLIGAEGTEPVGAPRRSGDPHERELDEELDAALACTFPASDPVGCLTTCRSNPR